MKVESRDMNKALQDDGHMPGSHAVVKELIPEIAEKEHVEGTIQSIRGLEEIGILPYDCRPCSFRGSRLVDLGANDIDPQEGGRIANLLRTIEEVRESYWE